MTKQASVRMTSRHHAQLIEHLFPGDGREAVAIAVCGRSEGAIRETLLVQEIEPVPYSICRREPDFITWPTDYILPLLNKAAERGLRVIKFHSHPGGFSEFSNQDDRSDRSLFPFISNWTGEDSRNASAVVLPGGRMFGRVVSPDGSFRELATIAVTGDDLSFFYPAGNLLVPEFAMRHAQLFGAGTTQTMRKLRVGVVGCSGTGSIVVLQLAHLGVAHLVLIDPDVVEEKNLNRIPGATMKDAVERAFKVDVAKRYIETLGLDTQVTALHSELGTPMAIRAIAECDIVFGCMDGAEGRHLLNRLATFYLLPYFDLGVRLDADGRGGVDQVCGTVHYLQPGGSSLLSRGVFTLEDVRAEGLRRADPEAYREQLRSKYIVGVQEDRPAVISVNMQIASMAVNEMLARLHPFRNEPNSDYAASRLSVKHGQLFSEPDGVPCLLLGRHAGRGDVRPLLERPDLSE
jgi:hypothetical protein